MKPDKDRQELDRLKGRVAELEQLLKASGQTEVLLKIAAGTTAVTGEDFFRSLVTNLASALKVRCIYLSELLEPKRDRLATLAVWEDGGLRENFEYDLAGTPCEEVVRTGQRYFCQNVQQTFPHDHFLKEKRVESYCGTPLLDRSGRVLGVLDVLHDQPMASMAATGPVLSIFADRAAAELNRLRAEEALKKREEHLRTIIDLTPECVKLVDGDGTLLAMNRAGLGMIEAESAEAVVGKSVYSVVAPEYRDAFQAFNETVCRNNKGTLEFEIVGLKGGRRLVQTHAVPLSLAGDGRCVHLAITRDITERKRVEEALRDSEDRFRSAFEKTAVGMVLLDNNGRFLRANRAFCTLVGYSEEELLPKTFLEITHPEDLEKNLPVVKRLMAGEIESFFVEKRYLHKQGHPIWVHASVASVRDAMGKPLNFIAQSQDITERKRAEEALRESQSRFMSFMEHLPGAAFIKDQEGHYLYLSKAAETLLQLETGAWQGKTDEQLFPPDIAAQLMANDRTVLTRGQALEVDEVTRTEQGTQHWLSVKFPMLAKDGAPAMLGGVAINITEQKRLEEQLRQAQKMEAIGRLAGGVAHDFNNLLTVIMGYSELLLSRMPSGDVGHRQVQEIKKAAERASSLTAQLLAFSRRQVVQRREVDVSAIVGNMTEMLRRLIGEDIHLVTHFEPALGFVKIDPAQLEQVIMNLAVNARDAMPQGGTLTIETANVWQAPVDVLRDGAMAAGPLVRLTVQDTGLGMDEETLSRIFEPFFTTKELGKGTGLGLSTVYGIITQSGGTIRASSDPGRGSTFTIYLPRVAPARGVVQAPAAAASALPGSETILLVEDERVVRQFVREILAMSGYQVLEAGSGDEALRLCESYQGPIHLLLTDIVMPGMRGTRLAELAVGVRRQMKVVFMSGYVKDSEVVLGSPFLHKPFTPGALARTMREVLDAPHERHET
jgi:PAS domain S-box-containing protein